MPKYEVIISWSEEDKAFVAKVPELPGCAADGKTYRDALANVELVIQEWIETSKDLGRPMVSSPLDEIDQIIKSSRKMVELGQDWDGEGANPIAESTWQRAGEFLHRNASILWAKYRLRIENPSIVPVPDGSIDLHWKLAGRELLINIPAAEDRWADYYGDNKQGGNIVKGTLHAKAANQWLFVWLTE